MKDPSMSRWTFLSGPNRSAAYFFAMLGNVLASLDTPLKDRSSPHDFSHPDYILVGRQHRSEERVGKYSRYHPREDGERYEGRHSLFRCLNVVVHITIFRHETHWVSKSQVRNDVQREVLDLARKVKGLASIDVSPQKAEEV